MKKTTVLRATATAAGLVFASAPVDAQYGMAQYTQSAVQTIDYTTRPPSQITCDAFSRYQLGSTAASCPTLAATHGTMQAFASADLPTRTTRLSARLTDDGTDTTTSLYAQTSANFGNSLSVFGTSGASDRLFFRFLTSESIGFVGGSSYLVHGGIARDFNLVLSGGNVGHFGRNDVIGGPDPRTTISRTPSTTHTLSGIDVLVDFFGASGVLRYDAGTTTVLRFGNNPHQARVLDAFVSMDLTLAGIDLVDDQGAIRSSASFDSEGNATLVVSPEPTTLTLFASGLVGIARIVRRRRRALRSRRETAHPFYCAGAVLVAGGGGR